ncbi:hypothetical protein Acr_13g0005830 [Actinidia rufa]|uniref:PHD finger protein MALE STERILITY 1-like ubiquitin-like domain-containing protein n=1 Tax=Actinidia rufa TaxID=165716 RepID=A0A7J0FKF8_9ERIC|nr:hypothetical protein Acr_13g0005830 [Actinidia rufa]
MNEATRDFDVYNDLAILYTNVLMNYPEMESVVLASRTALDGNSSHLKSEMMRDFPLGELLVVPVNSTSDELKEAAERALRDMYCVMGRFKVNEVKLSSGTGMDFGTELRYEGGVKNWVVRCDCGAVGDDGERIVACDVWQQS